MSSWKSLGDIYTEKVVLSNVNHNQSVEDIYNQLRHQRLVEALDHDPRQSEFRFDYEGAPKLAKGKTTKEYGKSPTSPGVVADTPLSDPTITPVEWTSKDTDIYNLLDPADQLKIKNIINNKAKIMLKGVFAPLVSGNSKKDKEEKVEQAMSGLMYSSINIGDLADALQLSAEDPNISLLNAEFLVNAAPGVYTIDNFIIKDNIPTSDGTPTKFFDITLNALRRLKQLGAGGRQAGPYEAAFQLLSNGKIHMEGKGDINVGKELLELKAENGRVGPEEWPARNNVVQSAVDSFTAAIDKYTPDQTDLKQIVTKNLKDHGTSYAVLLDMINNHFTDVPNINISSVRAEIVAPILDVLYKGKNVQPIIDAFAQGDDLELRAVLAHELFRLYKEEKSTGLGAWDRLVGINLTPGKEAICIFTDGSHMYNAVKDGSIRAVMPSIIATGAAAARDYMWQLLPTSGGMEIINN